MPISKQPICVIFTGPSGARVGQSLTKLVEYARPSRGTITIVEIEKKLVDRYRHNFPNDRYLGAIQEPTGLRVLLRKPKQYLEALWQETTRDALEQVKASDNSDVFISLHAVYYHTLSSEFFSAVAPAILKDWSNARNQPIRAVVTLIDDIYDVVSWLREPDNVFFLRKNLSEIEAGQRLADELLMCLQWRAMEISHAAALANALGVKHYLIAAKHHLSTVHGLLFEGKLPVYISHPISSPRSQLRTGQVGQYDAFVKAWEELEKALIQSRRLAPIFPTSIDELRFEQEDPHDQNTILPQQLRRWPHTKNRRITLHVPPPNELSLDPTRALENSGRKQYIDQMRPLLNILRRQTLMQIDARDRKLVEQANIIIVWRPYYGGTPAGGIESEIEHRNNLVDYGIFPPKVMRCFVMSPKSDLIDYRVEQMVTALENQLVDQNSEPPSKAKLLEFRIILQQHPQTLASDMTQIEQMQELLDQAHEFDFRRPLGSALEGDYATSQQLFNRDQWVELAASIMKMDRIATKFLRDGDETYPYDDDDPIRFVEWVESSLGP